MPDVIPFAPRNATPVPSAGASWSWPVRVMFRCSLPYLVLASLLWIVEFTDRATAFVARPFLSLWRPMALWMAAHLMQVAEPGSAAVSTLKITGLGSGLLQIDGDWAGKPRLSLDQRDQFYPVIAG